MEVNIILDRLFIHFNVKNAIELAKKMNVSQQAISSWRSRNSLNAVKKKCIELGIYKQIFESENLTSVKTAEINRALYAVFKRRSLAYLYYLLKQHNIENSADFFNFHAQKDEERNFMSFISEYFVDLTANTISFGIYRKEFIEFIALYLTVDELDFIFKNKEVFISSVYKIMEHKLLSGV